ncbi:MAG: MFS transporter, partial [Lentisphaeria bacterium]|nr:MFS transporter [Lentisphaeria bacterium]
MTQDTSVATPSAKKTWSVGTLVYDRRALAILFTLLLIGDVVWALRARTLQPIAQLLLRNHGSSDFFNALMLSSIPTALGMVMGPFLGYHSDRYRSRWGRRIPFLMISTPITFIGMIGMALSKHLDGLVMELFPSLTADEAALWILGVAWIIFEVGVLISTAVFNALINDVVPRSLLGRFFALFRIISLLVGAGFTFWFFGYAERNHDIVFTVVAVAYAIGITAMCLFVKEGEYPPVEKGGPGRRNNFAIAFEYIKKCSSSSYYWLLFSFIIVMGFVYMPSQAFIALYAKKLGIDMDFYGKIASVSYMTSVFLAYPLGIWVDKFHPLRCCGVVTAVFTIMTF